MKSNQNTISNIRLIYLMAVALLFAGAVSVQAQIPTPKVLYNFVNNSSDTGFVAGPIAQGRDGNMYGSGNRAGANSTGAIYKITPAGTESIFFNFPAGFAGCGYGLTIASDGNFYGACWIGNPNTKLGSLFRITPSGTFTDFYDFTGTNGDEYPVYPPIQGVDGNLYGVTDSDQTAGCGSVYKITLAGVYSNLHQLSAGDCLPSNIIQGTDGNLYGTVGDCSLGGNRGCAFKVSTKGVWKDFYNFNGNNGTIIFPSSGLTQGSNGMFYGTTLGGGANSNGVIYSLTSAGKITSIFDINNSTDGGLDSIMQATDGNFYGAALGGGPGNEGSVFELTAKNVLSAFLFPGTNVDGVQPNSPLLQNTNGTVYGANSSGGTGAVGTFFSLNIGAKPFVNLVSVSGKQGATVSMYGQGFTTTSVVKFDGVAAKTVTLSGSTFLTATVPAGALTGSVTVTTGSTTLTSRQTYKVVPTVVSFTPPSGPIGTSVTITGTALTQATLVKFNGTKTTFTVNSDTQITASVPTGATTGHIAVTTKGGSVSSKTVFTVN